MAHRVRILPSGHEFDVESRETLLQAGLRAGINFDYHCGNGTCGDCRGRIRSGTVDLVGHQEFRIPEEQVEQGYVLLCAATPTSDIEIEARELGCAQDIPFQSIDAKVSRLERLQDDLLVLHVRTPRSCSLKFLAGQYLDLVLDDLPPRRLAIASCPCDGMRLRFHLRRAAGDDFSEHVFQRIAKGHPVKLQGPHGAFTLDEDSRRPVMFVAAETGFAPIQSLIEHAISLEYEQPMHLYWLSRLPDGQYLANYCRSWEDGLDDFSYHAVTLPPAAGDADTAVLARILADHPGVADYDIYLSLPDDMAQAASQLLSGRGVPDAQVHVDRHGDSVRSEPETAKALAQAHEA